jgi:hypothetical protein
VRRQEELRVCTWTLERSEQAGKRRKAGRRQGRSQDEGSRCLAKLTIDEAMASFHHLLKEHLGSKPERASNEPEPEEVTEAHCFRLAETLVRLACPDAERCRDQRCRRKRRCRHLVQVQAYRNGTSRREDDPRPVSAHALRYGVWAYLSSLADAQIAGHCDPGDPEIG